MPSLSSGADIEPLTKHHCTDTSSLNIQKHTTDNTNNNKTCIPHIQVYSKVFRNVEQKDVLNHLYRLLLKTAV